MIFVLVLAFCILKIPNRRFREKLRIFFCVEENIFHNMIYFLKKYVFINKLKICFINLIFSKFFKDIITFQCILPSIKTHLKILIYNN